MNIVSPRRICPECGEPFTATHGRQAFCTPAHKETFHNRQHKRGGVAMSLLQVWRQGKRKGGENATYALRELCNLADRWNAEDKAAGRRPDVVVTTKRRGGWAAVDLEIPA